MNYSKLYDVTIGDESASGKAIHVQIDGVWRWVPLSQVKSMQRHPTAKGADMIEIADWLIEKFEQE